MIDLEMGEISLERNEDDRATRRDDAGGLNDDAETNNVSKEKSRESEKHRSKDGSKAKREDRDHGSKGRERSKERVSEDYTARDSDRYDARDRDRSESGRDRRKEERSQYGKHRDHDKDRDKERSRDRVREEEHNRDKYREKDRGKDLGRERERSTDREYERSRDHGKSRGRERENDSEIEKEREMVRDHDMAKDRDHDRSKTRDRESERERRKEINIEKGKDNKNREKEKDRDRTKDKEREKTKDREKDRDRDWEKERDKSKEKLREKEIDRSVESDRVKPRTKDRENWAAGAKEITFNKQNMSFLDAWTKLSFYYNKSRKLEEKKNAEKEALRLSKVFEEQDNLLAESDDEEPAGNTQNLAGVKILHGLDKVIEGGAVVLTLKDQDILRDGDVNDEIDMLENVEIGEQKMRDAAYNASKKRTGLYDDKFSDQSGPQRAILPQYDDPMEDEVSYLVEACIYLKSGWYLLSEAEKKLAEVLLFFSFEDLRASAKITSDYYTPEELLQFKKPKKKKSLRKKEKLDLDAMEAEAVSAGLGASDRGSRTDSRRQAAKEEKEKIEVEIRNRAYQAAYDKAEAASKILRHEQTLTFKSTEDEDFVFGEEYEDLQRSLEQERKLAHRKQDETAASGLQAVALRATSSKEQEHSQSQYTGEPQEEKVVITEVEEFVLGLQLTQGAQKPESEDVFMDDDDSPISLDTETKGDDVGWTQVEETTKAEVSDNENTDDASPDEIIHEVAVGKGLSGALKLLKERGALKETIDWGGRTMDKKKSKLVGIYDNEGAKEIRIERTDEFGRIMTPKEAFRMLSHKFHGKGPGKMKQEKRMKQYHEDLKTKQMKASDTPLHAVEKMREAQAQLKTPYLVLSGHVKPGQTSDPRSGFATVEKDHLGSLTPMLGDKKVEHFLGIKRKPDMGSMGPPPPKKSKS
ncbi:hypothetical protein ZIOFF_052705 [Zingiber officinale]|uniref:SART-1 family protein DOT2 n=1 Tax=Zingiber officinale TaxID=94328 RepID=A0A8J5FMG1_ZINOF|nr:hypothetical protein ZIOFF_052705 [Zingiber officinale]